MYARILNFGDSFSLDIKAPLKQTLAISSIYLRGIISPYITLPLLIIPMII